MSVGRDRIIFALDAPDRARAREWAVRLRGHVGALKVGLELFVSDGGADFARELAAAGDPRLFLDLKFHDIPNTVAGAVRSAASVGAWLVNVHALAGSEAMRLCRRAADEGAAKAGKTPPKVIAVTVLTSHGPETLRELGIPGEPSELVLRLARLAREAGLDGVVASPLEAAAIRDLWPEGLIVTPGIRPAGSGVDDQNRIATPGAAILSGSDYLVIGRPIAAAADPAAAADAIAVEVAGALARKAGA